MNRICQPTYFDVAWEILKDQSIHFPSWWIWKCSVKIKLATFSKMKAWTTETKWTRSNLKELQGEKKSNNRMSCQMMRGPWWDARLGKQSEPPWQGPIFLHLMISLTLITRTTTTTIITTIMRGSHLSPSNDFSDNDNNVNNDNDNERVPYFFV